jgi:AcrR family transcriptional regulator
MPTAVKRSYSSPRRAAQASRTRESIRTAAGRLFVHQGYVATTLAEVAREASVSERTVYAAFPSKAALFQHVLGVAIVGDEERVALADRPESRSLLVQDDAHALLTEVVSQATALLERAGDLIMVSVEAAGADPDMRAAADAGSEATYAHHLSLTRRLAQLAGLRPGMTARTAADLMYTLGSPHVHHLLRRQRGWSRSRYQTWLEATLKDQLLV